MFEITVPDAPSAVLCTDMFFETLKTVNILEVENEQKAPHTSNMGLQWSCNKKSLLQANNKGTRQADQHLCNLLSGKYSSKSCSMQNFNILASLSS